MGLRNYSSSRAGPPIQLAQDKNSTQDRTNREQLRPDHSPGGARMIPIRPKVGDTVKNRRSDDMFYTVLATWVSQYERPYMWLATPYSSSPVTVEITEMWEIFR